MENAWAFYRRSTGKQELSIEDQRHEAHAFALQRAWQIVREFEPIKGWGSGLTIDQDPTFQEMIRLAETGGHGVRYLIVYDVSRFGRLVTEEKIYWEQRFKKHGGIQIVYIHEDFKNDGSLNDTLLKVIKHAEAHEFSRKLSEVTLRGSKSHAALGHSVGGAAPFGYDRLEIDPAGNPVRVMASSNDRKGNTCHRVVWTPSPLKSPIVRRVFETYDRGIGLNRIADQLNQEKIPAPRGRFWSKTMVHNLLRNRAYVGERIYNRRNDKAHRRGENTSLRNPREVWVVKENAHKALVDRELFERVQARLQTKVINIGRTFHRPYLLTGLARCARCGYRMTGRSSTGNGHRYLMYTCSGYLRIGKAVCRSVHILSDTLEQEVLRSIREHLSSPNWKEEISTTLDAMVNQEFGSARNRLEELQRQLDEINREIANIIEAIKTAGRFSEPINQALADLETQREAVRRSIAEAERYANQRLGAEALAGRIMEYFGDFDRLYHDGLNLEERKELLRCYVHQVNIDHSPNEVKAEVWLYKIPIPLAQLTPALSGLEPLITRVNSGGRTLTLETNPVSDILPLVTKRFVALKRPYAHYRATAA
jgi:site-specific DNA recombinase